MLVLFTSRPALLAVFVAAGLFGQTIPPASVSTPAPVADNASQAPAATAADDSASAAPSSEVKPNLTDPGVVRAQQNLDRVRTLVRQGVLPALNLMKAQDDLNDALDTSILRFSASSLELQPEQADQMVTVADRMFLRRQRRAMQTKQLAESGIISRTEAETASADLIDAKMQLDLATDRARLVRDLAMQKSLAEVETDAETHPEWNGKLYTRYDGNGVFTRDQFEKISAAFLLAFGHSLPVSADGQTDVHRSMGLNHAGRVDVALNPDQREGLWLLRYLERNKIPYYAFRTAIAHKATGAHIHMGPGSQKLAETKSCCRAGF